MPATLTNDERRVSQPLLPRPTPTKKGPELRLIAAGGKTPRLHLFTYTIGNALFWTLWAAISVTADPWYWWPIVPLVGWALVLAAHLWHVCRPAAHAVAVRSHA